MLCQGKSYWQSEQKMLGMVLKRDFVTVFDIGTAVRNLVKKSLLTQKLNRWLSHWRCDIHSRIYVIVRQRFRINFEITSPSSAQSCIFGIGIMFYLSVCRLMGIYRNVNSQVILQITDNKCKIRLWNDFQQTGSSFLSTTFPKSELEKLQTSPTTTPPTRVNRISSAFFPPQ